jgi:hypothetical protein
MIRQSQVIVAAEGQHGTAIHQLLGLLRTLDNMPHPIEIGYTPSLESFC